RTSTSPAFGGSSSSSTISQCLPVSHMTAARVFIDGLQNGVRYAGRYNGRCAASTAGTPPAPPSHVALEDQAQADQGEVRLVPRDRLALFQHQRREPAGRDHDGIGVELGRYPADQPVDLAGEAVDDAGLQGLDRRLADDR